MSKRHEQRRRQQGHASGARWSDARRYVVSPRSKESQSGYWMVWDRLDQCYVEGGGRFSSYERAKNLANGLNAANQQGS